MPVQQCGTAGGAGGRTMLLSPLSPGTSSVDHLLPAWDAWRMGGWGPMCGFADASGHLEIIEKTEPFLSTVGNKKIFIFVS